MLWVSGGALGRAGDIFLGTSQKEASIRRRRGNKWDKSREVDWEGARWVRRDIG